MTYEHKADPVDAVVSVAVLHHLPDFWKAVGLYRIANMLKPQGKLFLFDVVFTFPVSGYQSELTKWIEFIHNHVGSEMAREAEIHSKDEFSTFDWIMKGILKQAGFGIEKTQSFPGFGVSYICTKK